jgi:hypothetical protein
MPDKVDQLLDVLEKGAESFSSYDDDENFEQDYEGEDFEDLENFTPKQRAKIRKMRRLQGRRKLGGGAGAAGLRLKNMRGNPLDIKAQLDVKVKLTSGATAFSSAGLGFEYVIFGADDVETGFNTIITDSLTRGAGSTVKLGMWGSTGAFTTGIYDSLQIALPSTGNITITSDVIDYPVLMKALITDMFQVTRIRVQATDTTANGLLSLTEKLKIVTKSIFGKRDEDVISMSAFKMPEQQQAGIIDIPVSFWVDANVSILSKIYNVNTTASVLQQTLTFSFFINKYYKHDPRHVG